MKQKRSDGESAKALREQGFLLRYKSESSIVESSVFKFSAYCWYCHSDFSVAMVAKTTLIKSAAPGLWLNTENIVTFLKL